MYVIYTNDKINNTIHMNKLIIAVLAALLAAPATLSAKSYTRALTIKGDFTTLQSNGNLEVEYTSSANTSATIKAEYPEDLDKVKATLRRGTLTLTTTGTHRGDIKIKLSAPAINDFRAAGNSEIEVKNSISASTVSLKTEGNASIDIESNINTSKLTINTSGNSHIDIDGNATSTQIKADTYLNSHIKISSANTDALDITTAGNSNFKCSGITTRSITAQSSGNSHMRLGGKAGTVEYTTEGNSHITADLLQAKSGRASTSGNSHITAAVHSLSRTSTGNSYIKNK